MKKDSSPYVALAFIIFVIALAIFLGGKGTSGNYKLQTKEPVSLGPSDAKVVISEYFDFQCPACQALAKEILPELEKQYSQKVRFIYYQFPLPQHEEGTKAAETSVCAQDQGKFWEYRDKLVEGYPSWTENTQLLEQYAKDTKLDINKFKSCRLSSDVKDKISQEFDSGVAKGVEATPTLFINDEKVVGVQPLSVYQSKIDALLATP